MLVYELGETQKVSNSQGMVSSMARHQYDSILHDLVRPKSPHKSVQDLERVFQESVQPCPRPNDAIQEPNTGCALIQDELIHVSDDTTNQTLPTM